MMRLHKSKKADLSISINAIVIIVLAMTFLGLGLGFVKGMFKDIGSTTGQVQEQIKQQILDDLRRGDKSLSFPTTQLKLELNDESVQAFGVKNTQSSGTLCFKVEFQAKDPATGVSVGSDVIGFEY